MINIDLVKFKESVIEGKSIIDLIKIYGGNILVITNMIYNLPLSEDEIALASTNRKLDIRNSLISKKLYKEEELAYHTRIIRVINTELREIEVLIDKA